MYLGPASERETKRRDTAAAGRYPFCEIVKSSLYRGRWRSTVAVQRCTVLSK